MKLENLGPHESQNVWNISEKELLLMILKRLERIEALIKAEDK